jgi:2-polyprenyl-3-methyl-5-hydroxy-6-metoxy-1,4-benzoquinol methylase/uncharacterized protein YbaR (Trm112 family)
MRVDSASIFCCLKCRAHLTVSVTEGDAERVTTGALTCSRCPRVYRIVRGVPRFVADDQYVENFGWQWDRYRRTQVDQFNGTKESETRFSRETEWTPESVRGCLTLDAGCGSGRFSAVAAQWGARVVAVDLASFAAEACERNMRDLNLDVLVVQASLSDLPFPTETFDRIFSLGVIQHTPEPARVISALPRLLRPGGELAYWMYERRWYHLLQPKYVLRPITKHLPPKVIHDLAAAAVSTMFPLTALMSKFPVTRPALAFMPVAARHLWGRLSIKQQWEWGVLDTLDWYGPQYDQPQVESQTIALLRESGLVGVHRTAAPGLAVVGRMPVSGPAESPMH